MRIDRLHIRNLASLRGEQTTVDLRQGPLAGAGLIAITGSTGAGKSTLLDAVCLPLFDQTPRLSGRGKDPRELLTRGTGEGEARLELTLDDGSRWRAEWSVHRAHGKADGALQASRLKVTDLASGDTAAEGKTEVREWVETHLGLTFEEFTGVILIAQGDFARFLHADARARGALLEKLTGTGIYSELSRAAYRRHKEAREEVQRWIERSEEIRPLEEAERQALERELKELEPRLQTLEETLSGLEGRRTWIHRAREIDSGRRRARRALETAFTAREKGADERRRLQAAEAASALAADLARLNEAGRRHQRAASEAARAGTDLENARGATTGALAELRRAHRRLHGHLEAARAHHQDERAGAPEEATLRALGEDRRSLLADADRAREAARKDQEARQRAAGLEARVETLGRELEGARRQLQELRLRQGVVDSRWQELDEELQRARREAALEEHRQALEAGQPCPLCGSTEHPALHHEGPRQGQLRLDGATATSAPEVQREPELAQLADERQALGREVEQAVAGLARAEAEGEVAVTGLGEARAEVEAGAREREEVRRRILDASRDWHQRLRALARAAGLDGEVAAVEAPPATEAESLQDPAALDAATARALELLHRHRRAVDEGGRLLEREEAAAAEPLRRTADVDRTLVELVGSTAAEPSAEELSERAPGADSGLDPEAPGRARRDLVATLDRAEAARRDLEHARREDRRAAQAAKEADAEDQGARAQLLEALRASPFQSEEELRTATLEPSRRDALRRKLTALDDRHRRAEADLERLDAEHQSHRSGAAEVGLAELADAGDGGLEEAASALEPRISEATERRNRARERRGTLKERLEADDEKRDRLRELGEARQRAEAAAELRGRLNSLIGEASGNKFREFAQGLSLELLLGLANRRLARLAPRYALVRKDDPVAPLEVEVVDHELADERRPIATLSGGETFLASLGLALGLADLRRGDLRLETLFLDEGFGTLDAATLDTALSVLETLQAEQGTQILLISHVGALQERLSHRIHVEKQGGGRSRLRIFEATPDGLPEG